MTSVRGALIGAVLARPRPGPRLGNVVMLGLRTGAGAEVVSWEGEPLTSASGVQGAFVTYERPSGTA